MKRRLFVDISDFCYFSNRKGVMGGISRVQVNIICSLLRCQQDGSEVIPVFYNPYLQKFFIVDKKLFGSGDPFNYHHYIDGLGKFRKWTPGRKSYNGKPLRSIFHSLKSKFYYLDGYIRSSISSGTDLMEDAHFEQRDVYLFLGSGWEVPYLTQAVSDLHRGIGVIPLFLIHDLMPLFAAKKDIPLNVQRFSQWLDVLSDHVESFLTYSENTKSDFTTYLSSNNQDAKVVFNIPLAHEFVRHATHNIRSQISELSNQEFVVFVGPLDGRKNGRKLLDVWERLLSELPQNKVPTLVLAGNHNPILNSLESLFKERPSLKSHVSFVNQPNDTELEFLYKNCLFSAFPSAYEGWGLPVGESAWFNKLCVTSNLTSMPEVIGAYADYCDPENDESLYQALKKPICDRNYLKERTDNLSNITLRTWDNVAEDILNVISQNDYFLLNCKSTK